MADEAIRVGGVEKIVAEESARIFQAASEVRLKVFVCGPAVPRECPTELLEPKQRIRRSVTQRIRERGSVVLWGEHLGGESEGDKDLVKAFDDAAREIHFASHAADLIIIFPSSPGSWAELGAFCVNKYIASKMLVFFDAEHKDSKGFLTVAVKKAAEMRRARVYFHDYANEEIIWREIDNAFSAEQSIRVTALDYGGE